MATIVASVPTAFEDVSLGPAAAAELPFPFEFAEAFVLISVVWLDSSFHDFKFSPYYKLLDASVN